MPLCSHVLMDKRISAEIPDNQLGDEYTGYVFKAHRWKRQARFPHDDGDDMVHDRAAHRLPLALTLAAGAVARVPRGEQQAHAERDSHSLLHMGNP